VLVYGIVNLCNSVPEDVVSAESFNYFKRCFDTQSGSSCFCEGLDGVFRHTSRQSTGIFAYYGLPMMILMILHCNLS